MRSYLYVSPVGTSLLRNFVLFSNKGIIDKYSNYKPEKWFYLAPEDPINTVPSGFLCNPPDDLLGSLREFVETDPRRASAEINGIEGIRELFYHEPEKVEVLLISTNTCNSLLCARIVAEHLRKKGFKVSHISLTTIKSIDEFEQGIIEILDKVVSRVREHRKRGGYVYINATPGYKPETTFLVIASILAGADSIVYIHEAFHRPISLPVPPISLNTGIAEEISRLYSEEKCLDTHVVNMYLGEKAVRHYMDMGILGLSSDGLQVCVKEWFWRLLKEYVSER